MSQRVRKAVFPVAGLGTRFLPATKSVPKEMLTVVDRPILQHVVEEAYEAGIEHCIFVTGRNKAVIEDYFDMAYELEDILLKRGKTKEWQALKADLPAPGAMSFTRQQAPLGLGHAVWCARELVGDEPFAVLLPDDLMVGSPGCLAQMVEAYNEVGGNIICAQDVPRERTSSYGIVTPGASRGRLTEVTGLVEKPKPEDAPSTLGIVGRYILQGEIMGVLETIGRGAGGEIQLTDGMAQMIGRQPFHAVTFDGDRHDCGDAAGFVVANIALALAREDVGPKVRAFLQGRA